MGLLKGDTRLSLVRRLYGHTDSINCLAVSNGGRVLASGGNDALRLWDLERCSPLSSSVYPQHNIGHRGQVTCVAWMPGAVSTRQTLCYCTALGYIVFWKEMEDNVYRELSARQLGTGSEILCLAVDFCKHKSFRIACGIRDQRVHVFTLSESRGLQSVFSVQLTASVPKSIAFSNNSRSDVYVFGLYDGQLITLDGGTGAILSSRTMSSDMCGFASVCARREKVVLDNTVDGFNIDDISSGNLIRTLPAGVSKRVPKQVVWAENSRIVIGGSDHGAVYVYDAETGETVDILRHAKEGFVQTITAYDGMGVTMVVSASSGSCDSPFITLWKTKSADMRTLVSIKWAVLHLVQMAIVLGALGVILQAFHLPSNSGVFSYSLRDLYNPIAHSWKSESIDQEKGWTQRELDQAHVEMEELKILMSSLLENKDK